MQVCGLRGCGTVSTVKDLRIYKGLQQLDKNLTGLPRPSKAIKGLKMVCKGLLVSLQVCKHLQEFVEVNPFHYPPSTIPM